jgi:hypothetical protein
VKIEICKLVPLGTSQLIRVAAPDVNLHHRGMPRISTASSTEGLIGSRRGWIELVFGQIANQRVALRVPAFENALFLWEAGQQHACTTCQTLVQTPLTVPALGR